MSLFAKARDLHRHRVWDFIAGVLDDALADDLGRQESQIGFARLVGRIIARTQRQQRNQTGDQFGDAAPVFGADRQRTLMLA